MVGEILSKVAVVEELDVHSHIPRPVLGAEAGESASSNMS